MNRNQKQLRAGKGLGCGRWRASGLGLLMICSGALQSTSAVAAVTNSQYIPLLGLFNVVLLPGTTALFGHSRPAFGPLNTPLVLDPAQAVHFDNSVTLFFGPPLGISPAVGYAGVPKDQSVGIVSGPASVQGSAAYSAVSGVCTAAGTAALPGSRAAGACIDPPREVLITPGIPGTPTYAPVLGELILDVSGGDNDYAVAEFSAAIDDEELFSVEISAQGDLLTIDDLAIEVSADLLRLDVDPLVIEAQLRDAFVEIGDGVFQLTDHTFFSSEVAFDPGTSLAFFTEGVQVGAAVLPEPSTTALGAVAIAAMLMAGWQGKRRSLRSGGI